jgi:hypothetical protein
MPLPPFEMLHRPPLAPAPASTLKVYSRRRHRITSSAVLAAQFRATPPRLVLLHLEDSKVQQKPVEGEILPPAPATAGALQLSLTDGTTETAPSKDRFLSSLATRVSELLLMPRTNGYGGALHAQIQLRAVAGALPVLQWSFRWVI